MQAGGEVGKRGGDGERCRSRSRCRFRSMIMSRCRSR